MRRERLRHKDMQHGTGKIPCPECGSLVRKSALPDHLKTSKCRKKRILDCRKTEKASSNDFPKPNHSHSNWKRYQAALDTEEDDPMEIDIVGKCQPSTCSIAGNNIIETTQMPRGDSSLPQTPISPDVSLLIPQKTSPSENDGCVPQLESLESHGSTIELQRIAYLANSGPEIIPDSPRLPLYETSLGPLWFKYDHCDVYDLRMQVVNKKRELYAESAFPNLGNSSRLSGFIETSAPQSKFYRMLSGSQCVLCDDNLGRSPEAIYLHAKAHAEDRMPRLECSHWKIQFKFKSDLSLHSSRMETWALCCRNTHDEKHDDDDWVAKAFMADRQALIKLIGLWESLQLIWYLRIIDTLLKDYDYRRVKRKAQSAIAPSMAAASFVSARAQTVIQTGYEYRQGYTNVDTLLEKFKHTAINGPYYVVRKCGPRLRQSPVSGAGEVNMNIAHYTNHKLWVTESASEFNLRDIRFDILGRSLEEMLRYFAGKGWMKAVQELLHYDIDIDSVDEVGETALMKAVRNDHEEVAKLLVDSGRSLMGRPPHG